MVPSQQKPFAERFPEAVYWLDLGLPPKAAKELVQAGCLSLADLAGKSREEMLATPGVGKASLRQLEGCRGFPFPSRKKKRGSSGRRRKRKARARGTKAAEKWPGAAYWRDLGLPPKPAKELARAGFRSLDDLQGKTRKDLLAIPGVGERAVAICEQRSGFRFASPLLELQKHGISLLVAHGLVRAGFDSVEKAGRLTREQFLTQPGLGEKGLKRLEAALGRQLDSPTEELCRQGLQRAAAYRLASAGIRQMQELAHRPDAELRSLGLTPGDIAACRQLIRAAGEDRP